VTTGKAFYEQVVGCIGKIIEYQNVQNTQHVFVTVFLGDSIRRDERHRGDFPIKPTQFFQRHPERTPILPANRSGSTKVRTENGIGCRMNLSPA
jgi:hypothetical protein